ncbi:DUF3788 domain-containing protein [Anaerofustis stercorihominis]|uniref:DUF3788 domain-containing protein n=1 Tax=Anaerofustis stercorihominis TaxID=214853 RepID=UPI00214BF1F4|nr:DUF3788 domain-containing protein [Anaerofustis stercorihominis]MCR2032262.1 DUF3788 domain-containing protein [Anaerofustis stercorihominis]
MEWKEIYPIDQKPTDKELSDYMISPLYEELCKYLSDEFNAKRSVEYSKCSAIPGWNIKYKKGSKSLCVVYPEKNIPKVMVVIGNKLETEAEAIIYTSSDYVMNRYKESKSNSGLGTWLVLDLLNEEVLSDIKRLIELKVKTK